MQNITQQKIISNKRRVFINKGDDFYQVLSFVQDPDGSIYCSMPEFTGIKWLSFQTGTNPNEFKMMMVDSPPDMGKFSMHGTGMLTFRAHKDVNGHTLIVKGHPLLDEAKKTAGVRHLFTYFPTVPKHIPGSPAFNRESDYVLKKTDQFNPFVMIFFAVPYTPGLTAEFEARFHADDMTDPPDAAFGTFALRYHNITWFYYRTKYMDKWPESTHICYFDGHKIPMIFATPGDELRLDLLREPEYRLEQNVLKIKM